MQWKRLCDGQYFCMGYRHGFTHHDDDDDDDDDGYSRERKPNAKYRSDADSEFMILI